MQFRKLAVICNACFWLTVIFQYWALARAIYTDVLNTIVILGVLSLIINLVWLLALLKGTTGNGENKTGSDTPNSKTGNINSISMQLFKWFNLISFAAQLIFLYSKYV
jgi:hypothetical protein